jgi:putative Mn2+ efflux pump MntP
MFVLAIATSIDAFVVGISFVLLSTPILLSALIIGIMAFILSFLVFYVGKKVRYVFGEEIRVLGGLLLIGIGLFILIGK